jgi:hypothetical protein
VRASSLCYTEPHLGSIRGAAGRTVSDPED